MLCAEGLNKAFGPTRAVNGVSFTARPGRVLALIGENGSGKSTLLRLIAGEELPDSGWLQWKDAVLRAKDVLLVHQELALCPHLTAAENMFLGTQSGPLHSPRELESKAGAILRDLGFGEIEPGMSTGRLSVSQRQVIEISRAVVRDVPIVLLDEPTSSLTDSDKQKLYRLIERLKDSGKTVVFISHFLEEVRSVSDDALILRDGSAVAFGEMSEFSDDQIVRHMVGREMSDLFPRSVRTTGEEVVVLNGLTGPKKKPSGIDLVVRRGEVLGIAGLNGAGRSELLRTLMHLRPTEAGIAIFKGRRFGNTHALWRHGIGFVSEERKLDGLAVRLSIAENLTLPTRRGVLSRPTEVERASRHWIEELKVVCQGPAQEMVNLSGGNQQKVAIARLLHAGCDVLLLDEPTRGIDIGSKAEIYRQIDKAAQNGAAILMTSSYLPELLGVCDRIAVMNRGRITAIFDAHSVSSEELIAECVK